MIESRDQTTIEGVQAYCLNSKIEKAGGTEDGLKQEVELRRKAGRQVDN
jgi:hypothetical protein